MDKNVKIYVHINKINGKLYIGQTSNDVTKRWNYGFGYKNNTYFWNAIKKYGWNNFTHIILFENLSFEMANIIEEYLIKKYKTTNKSYGYNLRYGGNNSQMSEESKSKISFSKIGHTVTDESRKKISENHANMKGENNPMYGKHHSEKTKDLIRKAISGDKHPYYGKKRSKETIQKMKDNHRDVNGINNPMYGKHLSDESKKKLSDAKKGWKMSEESKRKLSEYHNKEVCQFDLNLNLINIFKSATEAAISVNSNKSSISSVCKGRNKTCKGYIWKYMEDIVNEQKLDSITPT